MYRSEVSSPPLGMDGAVGALTHMGALDSRAPRSRRPLPSTLIFSASSDALKLKIKYQSMIIQGL